MELNKIFCGDASSVLKTLPDKSINCCVTSPPYYGLRDYGEHGQIGLEESPEQYIKKLVDVFSEVKRVLKDDGTLWLNIGDSYAGSGKGSAKYPENAAKYKQGTNLGMVGQKAVTRCKWGNAKHKDLLGIPWLLAFALRDDGWYLRQDIIWNKPNAMPESVKDRCTKSHEYIFLLSKNRKYYFDYEAIKEPRVCTNNKEVCGSLGTLGIQNKRLRSLGNIEKIFRPTPLTQHLGGNIPYNGEQSMRSKRDVWSIATRGYKGAHFATFPPDLISPCIAAGCPINGIVLDPFCGSNTVGLVAKQQGKNYIGIDINLDYCKLAEERIKKYLFGVEEVRTMNNDERYLISYVCEGNIRKAQQCTKTFLENLTSQKEQGFKKDMLNKLDKHKTNLIELPYNMQSLLRAEDVSNFQEDLFALRYDEAKVVENVLSTLKVSKQLSELGISYLPSLMLYGESGTGKTMLARYIAYKAELPFVYVQFSGLVDSHLGGTQSNLNKIFNYVKSNPCVLCFDEIDAVGMARGQIDDVGEMNRIVISLMQEFDTLSNDVIVVGTTNRYDRLDPALVRRFTLKHEVSLMQPTDVLNLALSFFDHASTDLNFVHSWCKDNFSNEEPASSVIEKCTSKLVEMILDKEG